MPRSWIFLAMFVVAISAYFYGHRQGQAVVQAQWQAEKAEANAQAAIAINKAQEAARATERYQAQKFQQAEAKLLEENRKVQNEKNDLLAAARNNGLRLPSAKSSNNSSGVPETAARASSDEAVNLNWPFLTNAVAAINSLRVVGWIPARVVNDCTVCSYECQS